MSDIVVLMGPQGAGKGTQAKLLSSMLAIPIVATGDILRDVAREETDLGREIRSTQSEGRLVSDEILARIIGDRTSQPDCTKGYILDGFPRTTVQAELLESTAKKQGHQILAVKIIVPKDLLWKRLTGRRTCPNCAAIYNIYLRPSREPGICDLDGEQLYTRSDDNEDAIAQRLALYDEKTRPILDYYRVSGRLLEIDGTGSPSDVFSRLVSQLSGVSEGADV